MAWPGTPEERFWKRVTKADGCWEWTGNRSHGYGLVCAGKKRVGAHRRSWEMANGPVPAGMWVLHKCDNPPCVRPDHLFLGHQKDNEADKVAKGRQRYGSRHGNAKLTEDDVIDIRSLRSFGATLRDLSTSFAVAEGVISSIANRRAWKHVP